jgi:hypothetical protein
MAPKKEHSKAEKGLSARLKSMAALPQAEWDFRWVVDEHEADHLSIYESAREVIRLASARLGCSVPVAMARLAARLNANPKLLSKPMGVDWVLGVFFYLTPAQLFAGVFPGPSIGFLDPSLELVHALRKLRIHRAGEGQGGRKEVPGSKLILELDPNISLQEAQDAFEFQLRLLRFDLKPALPSRGRPVMTILRALSFYRFSMGRSDTNLYLNFEAEMKLTSTCRPGRPLTDFGKRLYAIVDDTNSNDPVNVWSRELARFEASLRPAVDAMVTLLK